MVEISVSNGHRAVEDIDADIETAQKEHEEAAGVLNDKHEAVESLVEERKAAVVSTFDGKLVDRAQRLGINPNNFGTQAELEAGVQSAIDNGVSEVTPNSKEEEQA